MKIRLYISIAIHKSKDNFSIALVLKSSFNFRQLLVINNAKMQLIWLPIFSLSKLFDKLSACSLVFIVSNFWSLLYLCDSDNSGQHCFCCLKCYNWFWLCLVSRIRIHLWIMKYSNLEMWTKPFFDKLTQWINFRVNF